jgi:predicted AlkP superfamily pyrophosphatase or phosphodiesterase
MRFLIFIFTFSLAQTHFAQTPARPKLVVGIVVDQMRYDYLYRFNSKYGKDGFNRLLQGGAVAKIRISLTFPPIQHLAIAAFTQVLSLLFMVLSATIGLIGA